MKITYSIIAPIYNEIDNLPELYRRVKEVMDSSGEPWELILVDDGSTDGSTDGIRALAEKDKTPRAIVENLGNTVNTPYDEFAPIMSPNFTDRIYFSSVRPGNMGGSRNNFGQPDEVMGRFYSDIFTSQVNKGIWTQPHFPMNQSV